MTGPTDQEPQAPTTHVPQILIDEWMDGCVESFAWVEVTSEVVDPETAIQWVERLYPLEDRDEEEQYVCTGETVWQMPDTDYEDHGDGERPWVEATRDDDGALQFWVVTVVCAT